MVSSFAGRALVILGVVTLLVGTGWLGQSLLKAPATCMEPATQAFVPPTGEIVEAAAAVECEETVETALSTMPAIGSPPFIPISVPPQKADIKLNRNDRIIMSCLLGISEHAPATTGVAAIAKLIDTQEELDLLRWEGGRIQSELSNANRELQNTLMPKLEDRIQSGKYLTVDPKIRAADTDAYCLKLSGDLNVLRRDHVPSSPLEENLSPSTAYVVFKRGEESGMESSWAARRQLIETLKRDIVYLIDLLRK